MPPSLGEGQPLGTRRGVGYKSPDDKVLPPHASFPTTTITITTSLTLFSWSSSIPPLLAVFPSSGGSAPTAAGRLHLRTPLFNGSSLHLYRSQMSSTYLYQSLTQVSTSLIIQLGRYLSAWMIPDIRAPGPSSFGNVPLSNAPLCNPSPILRQLLNTINEISLLFFHLSYLAHPLLLSVL